MWATARDDPAAGARQNRNRVRAAADAAIIAGRCVHSRLIRP
jgi:hypothetical protein